MEIPVILVMLMEMMVTRVTINLCVCLFASVRMKGPKLKVGQLR